MALWQRFWLLGSVIWVVVCILSAATILVFSEAEEASKAIQPLVLAVAVPTVLYGVVWAYLRVRRK